MILNKVGSGFSLYELDSESELKEKCKAKYAMLLGDNTEGKRKYYFIETQHQESKNMIGLVNEGHGIEPTVLILKDLDLMLITSDESVYIIDLKKNEILSHMLCDSLIYEAIVDANDDKRIFIICELEVRCISAAGIMFWRYDCDVINDYKLHKDFLELIFDESTIKISLTDGHVLK